MINRMFVLLLVLNANQFSFGQTWGDSSIRNTEDIFSSVEQAPRFPGGISGLYSYIAKNLKKPQGSRFHFSNKYLLIRLIINKEGKVVFAEIEKGVNYDYNTAAIDIVKNMPNWVPGKQNGNPVYCYQLIPIVFVDG